MMRDCARVGVLTMIAVSAGCGSSESTILDDQPIQRRDSSSFVLSFEQEQDAGLVDKAPPSIGHQARLDLRAAGSGWEAVVTPRWGAPAAYTVTVEDKTAGCGIDYPAASFQATLYVQSLQAL